MFTLLPLALFLPTALACTSSSSYTLTFYGYPDNDPPSAQTAYNCGGRNFIAGGTGTFSDPLSMASAAGEFNKCEVVFLPYLQKYVRYEDYCQQCTDDFKQGKKHIDIWTGSSSKSGGQQQIECENSFTPDKSVSIVRSPVANYKVDTTALYQQGASPACRTTHMYPNAKASDYC